MNKEQTLGLTMILFVCASLAGCAYYNTVYNAEQLFNRAEKQRTQRGGSAAAAAGSYDLAIVQSHKILKFHGSSKYVDDALYMIGTSHLWRGKYVQAQDAFQDLLDRFSESEFREKAYFHIGLAYLWNNQSGAAATAFDKLGVEFPESRFNVEAVFRTAEEFLETNEYDAARTRLDAFMTLYPKSPFVVEAQLKLANTYYEEGDFEQALIQYQETLSKGPRLALDYEARLYVALSRRQLAEDILVNPDLYTDADLPEGLRLQFTALSDSSESDAGEALETPETPETLSDSLLQIRQDAEAMIQKSAEELRSLKKNARKLNMEMEHRIEIAVTDALLGNQDQALDELDVIARSKPRSFIAAQAYYEIAEIHRRRGKLTEAGEAYNAVRRQGKPGMYSDQATSKGNTIIARGNAVNALAAGQELLHHWQFIRGVSSENSPFLNAEKDSIEVVLEITARFEVLASQFLRIAEIDLFELDQPRLALREFRSLLNEYGGSELEPRAAFAIAWIYENILEEEREALGAYRLVGREYPESPQGREALRIVETWQERRLDADTAKGEFEPSFQP